jgi:hypothetical protein
MAVLHAFALLSMLLAGAASAAGVAQAPGAAQSPYGELRKVVGCGFGCCCCCMWPAECVSEPFIGITSRFALGCSAKGPPTSYAVCVWQPGRVATTSWQRWAGQLTPLLLPAVCSAAWACATAGISAKKGCAESTCNPVQVNYGGMVLVLSTGSMQRPAPGECRTSSGKGSEGDPTPHTLGGVEFTVLFSLRVACIQHPRWFSKSSPVLLPLRRAVTSPLQAPSP